MSQLAAVAAVAGAAGALVVLAGVWATRMVMLLLPEILIPS